MKHFTIPDIRKPRLPELSEYLTESLQSFSDVSGIPTTFFDNKSEICWECSVCPKLCTHFESYLTTGSPCRRNIQSALNFSSGLGEPYIFTCRLGLMNIAVSLIVDDEFLGTVIAGPFSLGHIRDSTIKTLLEINDLDNRALSKVVVFIKEMRTYSPREVSNLMILLNSCVLASISSNADYSKLRQSYDEELKIGISLMENKDDDRDMNYPYELEEKLRDSIFMGDRDNVEEVFNQLLQQISVIQFGDHNAIRNRIFEIIAVISREITKGNLQNEGAVTDFYNDIDDFNDIYDLEGLKVLALGILNKMADSVFSHIYTGTSAVIIDTIKYLNNNYMRKITLLEISEELHINQSYLSMLFKKEVGVKFSDYLTELRIDKAKKLLRTTSMSMVDISMQVGFEDQSYFTRVFKKESGITPKEYRQSVNSSQKNSPRALG